MTNVLSLMDAVLLQCESLLAVNLNLKKSFGVQNSHSKKSHPVR